MHWKNGTLATLIDKDELTALADGSGALSGEAEVFDNSTAGWTHAMFQLDVQFAAAASANGYVSLYLVPSFDGGTTYVDAGGGASPEAPPSLFVGQFDVNADAAKQLRAMGVAEPIPIQALKYKALLVNEGGQAFVGSATNENCLKIQPMRLV